MNIIIPSLDLLAKTTIDAGIYRLSYSS